MGTRPVHERKDYRRAVLTFVEAYVQENGYPPTFEEINNSVGLGGKSHVSYYLGALEREGRIEHTPHTPRGLRIVGALPSAFQIQVAGYIAAGEPLELIDRLERAIEITPDIADPRKELMALEVKGDSMVDELVGNGDILIVERQGEVRRGQMAVVHLKDRNAATLKQVYPEGERVRLQPAHPTLSPFYAAAEDVEIQGRVVAVIRRL